MLGGLLKVVGSELASRLGWLLLLGGLILPGMQAFDTFTATEATATVTEVRSVCRMQTSTKGRKRWKTFPCAQRADVEATGTSVRTKDWAKLAYSGPDGRARTAWANFGKLEIKEAAVGQQLQILYRGDKKPYVARPFDWRLASTGFAISFAGLVLLGIARRLARGNDGPEAVPAANSPKTETAVWRRERHTAPTQKVLASVPVPTSTAVTQRAGSVQRNRGWFG